MTKTIPLMKYICSEASTSLLPLSVNIGIGQGRHHY